jgi:hypothetical protein
MSDTPTQFASISLGPTGVLHFSDGNTLLDQASLITQAMPAPPAGNRYEVWLVNSSERLSLGILSVGGEGKGTLIFDDPQKRNLLANYGGVEVTVASNEGSESNGSERVAYAYTLPESGLGYLRGLMVAFPATPEQIGLIHGLTRNAEELERAAMEMLSAHESGNEAGVKENAESMLNLLVGDQNRDYHKDWNGDGQVTDPGDGYGLLLNGDQLGYIQAVYSHSDYAVNSAGASRNMIVNGEDVKTCTQNLARWSPELRDQLLAIFNAPTLSEMDTEIQRSAGLAEQILNGIDLNENTRVEPIADECGVLVTYESTYHMADMPLLPVNPFDTSTVTGGTALPSTTVTFASPITLTPTKRPSEADVTAQPVQPTDPPARPTNAPRPTKEPKPTKEPNNNNNNNNNSGDPKDKKK